MKRLFLLPLVSVLCFYSNGFAQWTDKYNGRFTPSNQPVIMGDTEIVGQYSVVFSSGCRVWPTLYDDNSITGNRFTWKKPTVDGSGIGDILWAPKNAFTNTETRSIQVEGESYATACPGFYGVCTVTATATSRDDSLILMRPRQWTIDLFPDSVHGGWTGYSHPTISNKTDDFATFTTWLLLMQDSTLAQLIDFRVMNDTLLAKNIILPPHSGKKAITYRFHADHGPITDTLRYPATITTHTWNGRSDSIYKCQVTVRFIPTGWKDTSTAAPATLKLEQLSLAPVYDSTTIVLDGRAENVYLGEATYPFKVTATPLLQGQFTLRVEANAQKNGVYDEDIKVYMDRLDFNGALRKDSVVIPVTVNASFKDRNADWEGVTVDRPSIKQVVLAKDHALWLNQGNILYSRDKGHTWNAAPYNGEQAEMKINDQGIVYAINLDKRLSTWNSTSGTSGWQQQSMCEIFWQYEDYTCREFNILDIAATKGSNAYAATDLWTAFNIYSGGIHITRIYNTPNDGKEWSNISPSYATIVALDSDQNLLEVNGHILQNDSRNTSHSVEGLITTIAISPFNEYYVGTKHRGIYYSSDEGSHWQKCSLNLQDIRSIACSSTADVYVAAYDHGVFHSSDNGITWEGMNGGLPTKQVTSITAGDNDHVYVGTAYSGVYRTVFKTPSASVPIHREETRGTFDLRSYPNPWNRELHIQVTLRTPAAVEYTLQDALGHVLATASGEYVSGTHSIPIPEAEKLEPGVYFCTVRHEGQIERVKMVKN